METTDKIDFHLLTKEEVQKLFKKAVRENDLSLIENLTKTLGIKEKIEINKIFKEICLYKRYSVLDYILFSEDFKPESNSIEDKEWAFEAMCSSGNLTGAYLFYQKLNINEESLGRSLELACIFGHLNIVKVLLNKQSFDKQADIHYENDIAILKACKEGHLEIVKYLMESPELTEHANIHMEINDVKDYPFVLASEYNRDEIVKYLMTLKGNKKPQIQSGEFAVVKEYLLKGDLDMLKHIIEKEKIDIHLDNDYLFIYAAGRNHYHILRYLILELKIEKTEDIINHLNEKPNQEIEELFNKRKLNNSLMNKLLKSIKINKIKNTKI